MFPPIREVGAQQFNSVVKWGICRTSTSEMCRRGLWKKYHLPTGVPEPLAPIDVLGIEKKTLIQPAHVFDSFVASQPETAAQDLDGSLRLMVPVPHLSAGKKWIVAEYIVEGNRSAQGVPDGRQSTTGTLQTAITSKNLWSHQTYIFSSFKKRQQSLETFRMDHNIGIHQRQIRACSVPYPQIVGLGKTQILPGSDKFHLREFLFHHLRGSIRRRIIH